MIKKQLLLLLILLSSYAGYSQTVTPQWKAGTGYILNFYPGKSPAGYDTLGYVSYLRAIFKNKGDSINNDGYVTHGFLNSKKYYNASDTVLTLATKYFARTKSDSLNNALHTLDQIFNGGFSIGGGLTLPSTGSATGITVINNSTGQFTQQERDLFSVNDNTGYTAFRRSYMDYAIGTDKLVFQYPSTLLSGSTAISWRNIGGVPALLSDISTVTSNKQNKILTSPFTPNSTGSVLATDSVQRALEKLQYQSSSERSRAVSAEYTKVDKINLNEGTALYKSDFSRLSTDFTNTGGFTLTTGGITTTNTGLANYYMLNRQYNINKRSGFLKFNPASDSFFAFYTVGLDANHTLGTMATVDVTAGQLKIYAPYNSDAAVIPSVVITKPYTFVAGRDYQVEMYRNFNKNTFVIHDQVTGISDTTIDNNNATGYLRDAFAISLLSGSSPVFKAINVSTKYKKHPLAFYVGDSITEGLNLFPDTTDAFSYKLANLNNYTSPVSGRSSGVIDGVTNRLPSEIIPIAPRYLVITIGTNGTNFTNASLTALCNAAIAAGITPIVNNIPWRSDNNNVARNVIINAVRTTLGLNGAAFDVVTSKNYANAIIDSSLFITEATLVHPNVAGNLRMYNSFVKQVPEVFSVENNDVNNAANFNFEFNPNATRLRWNSNYAGSVNSKNERMLDFGPSLMSDSATTMGYKFSLRDSLGVLRQNIIEMYRNGQTKFFRELYAAGGVRAANITGTTLAIANATTINSTLNVTGKVLLGGSNPIPDADTYIHMSLGGNNDRGLSVKLYTSTGFGTGIGSAIGTTNGSGTGDFANSGNLIISPRTSASRDIIFYGSDGTTIAQRMKISGAGVVTIPGLSTAGIVTNTAPGVIGTVSTVPVANGGTGQSTYTNGQLLIGNTTGSTLAKATLTGSAGTGMVVTNGAGSITLSNDTTVLVSKTFSGRYAQTGQAARFTTIIATAIPTYSTGGFTNLVLNNTTGNFEKTTVLTPYLDVTTTTQAMSANVRYIPNNASRVVFTLPSTAAEGDVFILTGKGAGGWQIGQNAGQTIHGAVDTTTGTGGNLMSTGRYNSIQLVCTVANTDFTIQSSQGTITTN